MSEAPRPDLVSRAVSGTLAVSSTLAAAVLAVGVGAWLATGAAPHAQAGAGEERVDAWPIAVIGLGLLLVTFTPVVQIAVALGAFIRLGERREALASGLVLVILVTSAVFAIVLGGGNR